MFSQKVMQAMREEFAKIAMAPMPPAAGKALTGGFRSRAKDFAKTIGKAAWRGFKSPQNPTASKAVSGAASTAANLASRAAAKMTTGVPTPTRAVSKGLGVIGPALGPLGAKLQAWNRPSTVQKAQKFTQPSGK